MPEDRQAGYIPNGHKIPLEQGTNWLLVIGIDQYEHHRHLQKAVADAKGFAEIMTTRYGFKHLQPPLYNQEATQRNIRRAVGQCKTLGEHDRLIVFYVGHGWYESKTNLGHIVPTEAENDPDSDFIPTNFITNIFHGVDAKHILLIVDCCFGGSFGVERNMMDVDALKKVNSQLDSKRSRMVLSSGGIEPVSDGLVSANNSPFTSPLLAILADNQSPVLVISEIFPLLRKKANWETDHQMAQYKVLQGLKHDDGELGFYCTDLESAEERAYKVAIQAHSIPIYEDFLYEDTFTNRPFKEDITRRLREKRAADAWKRIEKSDRIEDFLETEKLLLNTPYAALANKKMDELKRIRVQQREAQESEQQKLAALKRQKAEAEKQILKDKAEEDKKRQEASNRQKQEAYLLEQQKQVWQQEVEQQKKDKERLAREKNENEQKNKEQFAKEKPKQEQTQTQTQKASQWLKNSFDWRKSLPMWSKVGLFVVSVAFITYAASMEGLNQVALRWLNEAENKGSIVDPEIERKRQIDSTIIAGKKAYDAYDYVKAFSLLDKHKDNKAFDSEAQRDLGVMYRDGKGVIINYSEALKWLQKSAEQGYAKAQGNLGWMYDQGKGVKQDYKEAVKWYQKAAEQGDAKYQSNLGIMYRDGNGVKQDYKEAIKWYQKAAEQGYADGQCNLGDMYSDGKGFKQDYKEAIKWYQKAVDQGNARGQVCLGWLHENGNGVKQDYKESVKWYQKAAEQGYDYGQNNLGRMYEDGKGVKKDITEAVRLYRLAAKQGHKDATDNLKRLGYSE